MATLSDKLVTMLGDTRITDVVGDRVYRMRAKQGTREPYIILWMPTHERVGHLRGTTNLEHPVVRFDLFGLNFPILDQLRDTIIDMMTDTNGPFGAIYRFGTELYEDDTRLYHLMADFSVWHKVGS